MVVCGVVTLAVVVVVRGVVVVATVDVTSGADAKVEGEIFLDNFRADFCTSSLFCRFYEYYY